MSVFPRLNTPLRVAVGILLVVLAALGMFEAVEEEKAAAPVSKGAPAPAITGAALDGKPFDAEGLAGKVLVLDFWATWCAPCVHELPMLARVAAATRDEATFLAASLDGGATREQDVRNFFAGRELPLVMFPDEATGVRFNVKALPTLYVIDRKGLIVATHRGEPSETELLEEIAAAAAR